MNNGGTVRNGHGYVGANTSGSNNLALITGAGSVWSNGLDLEIGAFSGNNRMMVSNGATVFTGGNGFIGPTTNGSANSAVVTDAGSRWLVASNLYVGSNSAVSWLEIRNGAVVGNGLSTIGQSVPSSNNVAIVTGSGSVWSNASTLYVGFGGRSNQLLVSEGGVVRDVLSYVGFNSTSSGNRAVVTGPGSLWSNQFELYLGFGGAGNELVISDGGIARSSIGTVGFNATSSNNRAVVTGPGSVWSNTFEYYLGFGGAGNQLLVSEGATLHNSIGTVGNSVSGSNNAALVTGPGSLWSNAVDLFIGRSGTRNHLVVSNGASVLAAGAGYIGLNINANANAVTVTDPGRSWLMASNLFVGSNGALNRLVISNGALVVNSNAFLGFTASSRSNTALVTGAGSVWSNRQTLVVGQTGAVNRVLVSDGARLESRFGTIGVAAPSTNNEVVVAGPGSFWRVEQGFTVGSSGSGNRLVVTNGGRVRGSGTIGANTSGTNNEVVVTGAGSSWTNGSNLNVGSAGSGNRLVITDGAEVVEQPFNVILGASSQSINNRIVVDGGSLRVINSSSDLNVRRGTNVLNAGLIDVGRLLLTNGQGFFEFNGGTLVTRSAVISNGAPFTVGRLGSVPAVWDVRGGANDHFLADPLFVGFNSPLNQLLLTNGAALYGHGSVLGLNAAGSNNLALVTGPGSIWSNAAPLLVGSNGMGNRLVVSNGGFVAARDPGTPLVVGDSLMSANNEVVVTGAGSVYSNVAGINVNLGENGSSNRMRIEHGGLLVANVLIGFRLSSTGNVLTVTDPGSRLVVPRDDIEIVVGGNGLGNVLIVSNGAALLADGGAIGYNASSSNNLAVVTGANSVWSHQSTLQVGCFGPRNRLLIADSGTVFASNAVNVALDIVTSSHNLIQVSDGTLRVQNLAGTGTLDIRSGTNRLDAGLVDVDRLVITNALGEFEFNGGTLRTAGTTIGHGRKLAVGNGTSVATLELRGGAHVLLGGLAVSNQASLTGHGSVAGALTVHPGGQLAPGASLGKIVLNNSPSLLGAVLMEISKDGPALTNDQIQVATALTYGGSLIVSNLGPAVPAAGDRYPLFSAASYSGAFAGISLPALPAGLNWSNKLLADGSLEVVPWSGPKIGGVTVSGTNLTFTITDGFPGGAYDVLTSTDVGVPLENWSVLSSGLFDWLGTATVTNGISPGDPARFFSIGTP